MRDEGLDRAHTVRSFSSAPFSVAVGPLAALGSTGAFYYARALPGSRPFVLMLNQNQDAFWHPDSDGAIDGT